MGSFKDLWAGLKTQLNLTDHDLEKPMKSLVIYHENCADGFGAAYAAWKSLGDQAEYVPAHYGDCVISDGSIQIKDATYLLTGRNVYILDYSLPVSEMHLLLESAKHTVWLDHHKTAFDNWLTSDFLTPDYQHYAKVTDRFHLRLDNQKSGCRLAWEYFHPTLPVPMGIQYIEDRDLWRFQFDDTRAFCEGLKHENQDFEIWDIIFNSPLLIQDVIRRGETLLNAMERRVQTVAKRPLRHIRLSNGNGEAIEFRCANVCNEISETGNAICKKTGFPSATFFISTEKGEVVVSLRSTDDIGVDVSQVARQYGGGGHRNAAGFSMGVQTFFASIWV